MPPGSETTSTGSSRSSGRPVAFSASPTSSVPARPAASPSSTSLASAVPSSRRTPPASIAVTRPPTRTRWPACAARSTRSMSIAVGAPSPRIAPSGPGIPLGDAEEPGACVDPGRGRGGRAGRHGLAERDVGALPGHDREPAVRGGGVRPLHDARDRRGAPLDEIRRRDAAAREAADQDAGTTDLEVGRPPIAVPMHLRDRAADLDQSPLERGRRRGPDRADARPARSDDADLVRAEARCAPRLADACR